MTIGQVWLGFMGYYLNSQGLGHCRYRAYEKETQPPHLNYFKFIFRGVGEVPGLKRHLNLPK